MRYRLLNSRIEIDSNLFVFYDFLPKLFATKPAWNPNLWWFLVYYQLDLSFDPWMDIYRFFFNINFVFYNNRHDSFFLRIRCARPWGCWSKPFQWRSFIYKRCFINNLYSSGSSISDITVQFEMADKTTFSNQIAPSLLVYFKIFKASSTDLLSYIIHYQSHFSSWHRTIPQFHGVLPCDVYYRIIWLIIFYYRYDL